MAATLKGLPRRRRRRSVNKQKPFIIEMLQAIVEQAANIKSLLDLCLGTACLLAYSAFLRFDESRRIIPVDITFHEDWISINIHISNLDQLRKGEEVIVAKTGSNLCPVTMLESYLCGASGLQRWINY